MSYPETSKKLMDEVEAWRCHDCDHATVDYAAAVLHDANNNHSSMYGNRSLLLLLRKGMEGILEKARQ